MIFLLTAMKISYVLDLKLEVIPNPTDVNTEEIKTKRNKRVEDELLCRGHILKALSICLYDLFIFVSSPNEIWETVESKYNTEKQGTNKFLIMKYFEY